MIDTTETWEIKRSNSKLNKLILIGIGSVPIGIWLARGGVAHSHGEYTIILGWVFIIFFGSGLVKVLLDKFKRKELPVVISTNGLHDANYHTQEIPWFAITGVSKTNVHSTQFICIEIEPNQVANLKLTTHGKFVNGLNRTFGWGNSFYLSNVDLDIEFDELYEVISAYLKAHRSRISPET